jgi:thioredoxin reductase
MDFQKNNSFEEDNHIKNSNSVFSIGELPNNSFFGELLQISQMMKMT